MSVTTLIDHWSQKREAHPSTDPLSPLAHKDYKWAMAVDLDTCTGCNACTTACYAENNLPVVGKEVFLHGQSMHWIRIERYWDEDDREIPDQGASFMPMMCQQCEAAPCETVCPAGATNHTPDGLNSQVYNRCIGSRYCEANCPYKVRYFNWYDFSDASGSHYAWTAPMEQQLNPDVTVRSKGVMEKCTFCVQRLYSAKNKARSEGRLVQEGEVTTACAQACPTGAITFGNMLDPESEIHKMWKRQQVDIAKDEQFKSEDVRGYRVLEELRAYPSVMYMERVRETEV